MSDLSDNKSFIKKSTGQNGGVLPSVGDYALAIAEEAIVTVARG